MVPQAMGPCGGEGDRPRFSGATEISRDTERAGHPWSRDERAQRGPCRTGWARANRRTASRKSRERQQHPDRDAQFQHTCRTAQEFQGRGQAVGAADARILGAPQILESRPMMD